MGTMRVEHDLLGECSVPRDVYWGIHTSRAVRNFPFEGRRTNRDLIHALVQVKKACCLTNMELGFLGSSVGGAIQTACDDIIEGRLDDQFPISSLQGGAGTSVNMNANEVIANRALEILGKEKGQYEYCHPIEHVNLHQSTNDVFPTALKMAAIAGVRKLSQSAAALQGALQGKEKEFADIVICGRTELQSALPVTLGAQFSSWAEAVARDRWRAFKCEERLRVVNLGGTAVGTGLTAPRSYIFRVVEKLRGLCGYGLTRGENLMDQTANADAFVEVSGILSAHATDLSKICADMRQLHFIGEIRLPHVQAGSSIMPGKVNPVIMEAVMSAAIRVQANHSVIADCASRGSLQINEFIPLIAETLLESLELLDTSDRILQEHVEKIEADTEICKVNVSRATTTVTALLPFIGYDKAQELVKKYDVHKDGGFVDYLISELGSDIVNEALSPAQVMALGFSRRSILNADRT
ncbi:MAG: aspartate ammonia-lyase [Chitinispirillaceae bacterium]